MKKRFGMLVLASTLRDPVLFGDVLNHIRRWVETTDGDGFLELEHD